MWTIVTAHERQLSLPCCQCPQIFCAESTYAQHRGTKRSKRQFGLHHDVRIARFFASEFASTDRNSHSLPQPPYGVKNDGVNDPCSMLSTLSAYARFFSRSFDENAVESFRFLYTGAKGLKTRASKNSLCMSTLPEASNAHVDSHLILGDCRVMELFACDCKKRWLNFHVIGDLRCHLPNQVTDFVVTLVNEATFGARHGTVRSEALPQAHVVGRHFSDQRYLNRIASWNSLLLTSYFSDFNGRDVSQLEAPFI